MFSGNKKRPAWAAPLRRSPKKPPGLTNWLFRKYKFLTFESEYIFERECRRNKDSYALRIMIQNFKKVRKDGNRNGWFRKVKFDR
jgi:hypothetical protein